MLTIDNKSSLVHWSKSSQIPDEYVHHQAIAEVLETPAAWASAAMALT